MRCVPIWYVDVQKNSSSPSGYRAFANFMVYLVFVPVADVGGGVLIRGDELFGTGGQGSIGTGIMNQPPLNSFAPNYDGSRGGVYVVRFSNYKFPSDSGQFTDYITPDGFCIVRYKQGLNARQRDQCYTTNIMASSGIVPFTWDATTGVAKLFLTPPSVAELVAQFKDRFETDFHGNLFNLDTSYTPPNIELTMNCPAAQYARYAYATNVDPEIISGDPIDNPLFTIPFARS